MVVTDIFSYALEHMHKWAHFKQEMDKKRTSFLHHFSLHTDKVRI